MKRRLVSLAFVVGCGSFGAANEPADAGAPATDAMVTDASTDAPEASAPRASKRCAESVGALYCEDFSQRADENEVVAAVNGASKQNAGNPTWAIVGGPLGDPSRSLQTALATTTGRGDSQLGFPFASPPPVRLRLFATMRVDEVSAVDVLTLGFTRPSAANEFVYVTIIDGDFRLAEYDPGGNPVAQGRLAVSPGVTYRVELRVELAAGAATLVVDDTLVASLVLARVVASDLMTGFRAQYGLFTEMDGRPPARVTYDDIELRGD